MPKSDYSYQSELLGKGIDIAIEAIKKFPPNGFNESNIEHFVNFYLKIKSQALNPEEKYKTHSSLNHLKKEVLTFFQEGSGEAVEYFWNQLDQNNILVFQRENKVTKVLKRGKISNKNEYEFIIDSIIPQRQAGLITDDDVVKLNRMILVFETNNS